MKRYAILHRESIDAPGVRSFEAITFGGELGKFALSFENLEEKAAAGLAADPRVKAISPVMPTRLIGPLGSPDAIADGPSWGIAAVGADRSPYTGVGVTVAVLDTGIDRDHPAFAGIDIIEKDFGGDGNGDRHGHGTHCAGTLFGRDVGERIGVARGVNRVLIGKVVNDQGTGGSDMIFEALIWAMRERADIISLSLGFDFPGMVSRLTAGGWPADLAILAALEAYRGNLRMFDAMMGVLKAQIAFGVSPLVIAAAGNESCREVNPEYRIAASLPAAADDVIAVVVIARNGENFKIADFSNSLALLSAPGVGIKSAWPGGKLRTLNGTSMACPHVAGVAALWWEALQRSGTRPNALNVKARLLTAARKNVFATGTDEADIGQGLISAPQ